MIRADNNARPLKKHWNLGKLASKDTLENVSAFRNALERWDSLVQPVLLVTENTQLSKGPSKETVAIARLVVEAWDAPDSLSIVLTTETNEQRSLKIVPTMSVACFMPLVQSAVKTWFARGSRLQLRFGGRPLADSDNLRDMGIEAGAQLRVSATTAPQGLDIEATEGAPLIRQV